MPGKIFTIFFLLLFFSVKGWSQVACTTLGQNPSTAFPVCGTTVFNQQTVPVCGGNTIPVPSCNGDGITYQDLNPFWYSFTCYTSGTLGFLITPKNLGDDYDWQLFDVTGHNPTDIYTNPSLIVTGNWSGTYGITGAKAGGSSNIECASDPLANQTTFSAMPAIAQGHKYLLLISHFSGDNQSGYSLSFGGGTGSITDSVKPAMQTAIAKCDAQVIYLKLNKRVKCSSLALNGSDFYISQSAAKVTSAVGGNCSASFDMDSVVINLDKRLQPGNYSLVIQNGDDKNTLIDNCDNTIPELDSISFTIDPLQPTPFDSIVPVKCTPNILQFYFTNPIKCNSVAADGSDFIITGNPPISVIRAYGDSCTNGLSNIINVVLNKTVLTAGSYNITLQKGSDGNTLVDECAQETPAGSTLAFTTADTVSADFAYRVGFGCVYDTLFYSQGGKDHVNEWNWTFDVDGVSTAEDSIFLFTGYGSKHISLSCSNGVCFDSSSADILLDNQLTARFVMAPSTLCPEDVAVYTDSSTGKIVSWYWIFGDGTTSTQQNPPPKKYASITERDGRYYPVALIVKNDINCFDTAETRIQVLYNCYITVPTAFTPNGDGLNDFLYPLNAYKADNLEFRIYNRYGQMVFETTNWTKKWDGKIDGKPQASGTYVWMLSYKEHDTGKNVFLKGTSVLIR
jgi:gliding motility-associated-like protein